MSESNLEKWVELKHKESEITRKELEIESQILDLKDQKEKLGKEKLDIKRQALECFDNLFSTNPEEKEEIPVAKKSEIKSVWENQESDVKETNFVKKELNTNTIETVNAEIVEEVSEIEVPVEMSREKQVTQEVSLEDIPEISEQVIDKKEEKKSTFCLPDELQRTRPSLTEVQEKQTVNMDVPTFFSKMRKEKNLSDFVGNDIL